MKNHRIAPLKSFRVRDIFVPGSGGPQMTAAKVLVAFFILTVSMCSGVQAGPSWNSGTWVEDGSPGPTLTGQCIQQWACRAPPGQSGAVHTDPGSRSTVGAATVGACMAPKPSEACQYCVDQTDCSRTDLGWRTREALCCKP